MTEFVLVLIGIAAIALAFGIGFGRLVKRAIDRWLRTMGD